MSEVFSFEEENRKKRDKNKTNVLKNYQMKEKPFHVGSLDLNDPYSGAPIYTASKKYMEELEAEEKAADGYAADGEAFDEAVDGGAFATQGEEPAEGESGAFDSSGMSDEEIDLANEIYKRLMDEAAADERAKQEEIEAIKRQQEATSADFNAETGSYSGLYGKKPMNQSEEEVLASIMNENNSYKKSIEDIIKENQG